MADQFTYERKGTIHKQGVLDVEQDSNGEVVSVWFNCLALPFRVSQCTGSRAEDMRTMYRHREKEPSIRAIQMGPEPEELPSTKRLSEDEEWINSLEERSNS